MTILLQSVLTLWVFIVVALLIVLVRVDIVGKIRGEAIDVVHSYLENRIVNHDWNTPWIEPELNFNRIRKPSYQIMVFDLTRWTFKSFYPDLIQYRNG